MRVFQDVVLACGCSGALELALDVLLNPGDNVLLPKPGFSIYQTLSISRGHEVRHYNLLVRFTTRIMENFSLQPRAYFLLLPELLSVILLKKQGKVKLILIFN